jgi:hypothetical protein
MGDVPVFDGRFNFQFLNEVAQAGAQDDTNLWGRVVLATDSFASFLYFVV